MSYKLSKHAAHNLNYHFVWCPKFRRKVLEGEVAVSLDGLIRFKAGQIGLEVLALEIMPDHVHLFVSAPPTISPHNIANHIKGFTSHELRERYPALKTRLPTLWSRAYYVGSCGHASETVVRMYIENQKGK
jgi:putative transposase